MSNFMESLRATGRTTRMLEEAKQLADAGHIVCLVFHTARYANDVRLKQTEHPPLIKYESASSINFDWFTMTIRGEDCIVLVDHYAIEQRYSQIEMLHRFDGKEDQQDE